LGGALGVKVLVVEVAAGFRDVQLQRGRELASEQQVLVDRGEEWVRDDFPEVILGAEALIFLLVQQLQHDVHKLITVLDLVLFLVGEHDL
jgi:hypothetical protein